MIISYCGLLFICLRVMLLGRIALRLCEMISFKNFNTGTVVWFKKIEIGFPLLFTRQQQQSASARFYARKILLGLSPCDSDSRLPELPATGYRRLTQNH